MRLLVTGGCGFIGSEFVRMTLREHAEDRIVVLDKLTYAGNLHNLDSVLENPRLRCVRGDITNRALVNELASDVDVIVNFAAETHVDRSLESPGGFIQTDVFGTWVLIEAARVYSHQRFLQVSTDEVYGDVAGRRSTEDSPLRPRSPYSASKAGAELQIQAYAATYGLPAMVTRGSNTYGPYQFPEKIVPLFILNALEGRPLPIYGDGMAVRDYIHVTDHCSAIDMVLRRGTPGMTYNVGGGNEVTAVEMADMILDSVGAPASLKRHVDDRRGHDRRYSIDTRRMLTLGWRPDTVLRPGIAATVGWYRDGAEWWGPLRGAEYWQFYQRNYHEPQATAAP